MLFKSFSMFLLFSLYLSTIDFLDPCMYLCLCILSRYIRSLFAVYSIFHCFSFSISTNLTFTFYISVSVSVSVFHPFLSFYFFVYIYFLLFFLFIIFLFIIHILHICFCLSLCLTFFVSLLLMFLLSRSPSSSFYRVCQGLWPS